MSALRSAFEKAGLDTAEARVCAAGDEALRLNDGDPHKAAATFVKLLLAQPDGLRLLEIAVEKYLHDLVAARHDCLDIQINDARGGQNPLSGVDHGDLDAQGFHVDSAQPNEAVEGHSSFAEKARIIVPSAASPSLPAEGHLSYAEQANQKMPSAERSSCGGRDQISVDAHVRCVPAAASPRQPALPPFKPPVPGKPRSFADLKTSLPFICKLSDGSDFLSENFGAMRRAFNGSFFDQAMRFQALNYCTPGSDADLVRDRIALPRLQRMKVLALEYQALMLSKRASVSLQQFFDRRVKILELPNV